MAAIVLSAGMCPGLGIGDIAGALARQRELVTTGAGLPEGGARLVAGSGVGIVTLVAVTSGAVPQPASSTAARTAAAPPIRITRFIRLTRAAFLPTSTPRPAGRSPGRRPPRPVAQAAPRRSPP